MGNATVSTAHEKNKRVVLNIISNLSYEAVKIVFGFVLPRLYLVNFGSDVNGLDSTIKNIFAYLALLEAGVGLSAQYSLYHPVAIGDTDRINFILASARRFYLRSGMIYTVLTLLFAVGYPLVVRTSLDYFTVFSVILLYGIPGIILFLWRGKYNAFLEVEGKKYILTTLQTVTLIISNLLRLVFLLISDNLILIQATYCVPSIIQIFFIIIYVRRHYGWIDWHAKPDNSALSQKRSVLVHQISGCIFSNTDTVIISIMCGMNYASVYAVFSLFFANFQKVVTSFTNGLTFKFGQMFHTDFERFKREFSLYETVYYTLLFAAYTILTAFLMPVIRLYTSGIADAAIYDNTVALLLFAAVTALTGTEAPMLQQLYVAGKFDDTRNQAIWEMAINITVSIIATWRFGLIGCLIGTVAALLYRNNALIIYTARRILDRSCLQLYKKIAVNLALGAGIIMLLGTDSCEATSYLRVILTVIPNALWIAAVFIAVNVLINLRECIAFVRAHRRRA